MALTRLQFARVDSYITMKIPLRNLTEYSVSSTPSFPLSQYTPYSENGTFICQCIVHFARGNKARKAMATCKVFFFLFVRSLFSTNPPHLYRRSREQDRHVVLLKTHFSGNSEWNINILLLLIFKDFADPFQFPAESRHRVFTAALSD